MPSISTKNRTPDKWEIQSDLDTLIRAAEIRADKRRLARAMELAREKRAELEKLATTKESK